MEPIVQLCLIITAAGSLCYSISIQNLVCDRYKELSIFQERLIIREKELRELETSLMEQRDADELFMPKIAYRLLEECIDCSDKE